MNKDTFQRGMFFLTEAFPKMEFSFELYWMALKDLPDDQFEKAVIDVIKNVTELYPGSNLIAILRQKCNDIYKRSIEGGTQKMLLEASDPPPPEWNALIKKLAAQKGIPGGDDVKKK